MYIWQIKATFGEGTGTRPDYLVNRADQKIAQKSRNSHMLRCHMLRSVAGTFGRDCYNLLRSLK
jgi:hypothetical protein